MDSRQKRLVSFPPFLTRGILSRSYTSDFLLAMVMPFFFLKIVASPACGENGMCSHPRTGDATDEKIAEKKSREIQ